MAEGEKVDYEKLCHLWEFTADSSNEFLEKKLMIIWHLTAKAFIIVLKNYFQYPMATS